MLSTKQCPLAQILATKWSPETLHQNRVLVTEQAPHVGTRTGRMGPNPDFYLSFKNLFFFSCFPFILSQPLILKVTDRGLPDWLV